MLTSQGVIHIKSKKLNFFQVQAAVYKYPKHKCNMLTLLSTKYN